MFVGIEWFGRTLNFTTFNLCGTEEASLLGSYATNYSTRYRFNPIVEWVALSACNHPKVRWWIVGRASTRRSRDRGQMLCQDNKLMLNSNFAASCSQYRWTKLHIFPRSFPFIRERQKPVGSSFVRFRFSLNWCIGASFEIRHFHCPAWRWLKMISILRPTKTAPAPAC